MKSTSPFSAAPLLLGASLIATACSGQIPSPFEGYPRAHRQEVYGLGQYLGEANAAEYDGPAGVVTLSMDDTGLGGFGFAYHLNDFLALRMEFVFGSADFRASGAGLPGDVRRDAWLQTGKLNLDYNIINRRLTPIVTAGIGYQWTTVELQDVPPGYACWWDPWWGYVCYYDQPVYSEVDFTWNVGAGFRWDIAENIFVKAVVGANWIQYQDADDLTTQYEGIISIGWSF